MTIARINGDDDAPVLSGKTVVVKDSLFAEDVIEIPVEFHDAILDRYSKVEEFTTAQKAMNEATKKVTGFMHRFEQTLPKDPFTGETVLVVSGIEARITLEQKEKLTTKKLPD